MFRISFGNGQVTDSFSSLPKCVQALDQQKEYSRRINQPTGNLTVQKQDADTGEWFRYCY
jgi:uncharacterized C2H2 Zn-finger protein